MSDQQSKNTVPIIPGTIEISAAEFKKFQQLIYSSAGITMKDDKQTLVQGRLLRRLRYFEMKSYSDYFHLISSPDQKHEFQMAIDLLTTNETYFFREPQHFDFLKNTVLPQHKQGVFKVWSAASSTGHEAYSIAMLLADVLGDKAWDILGTDISSQVLETAKCGQYPLDNAQRISESYIKRYCLKDVHSKEGTFIVAPELRRRTSFRHLNLNGSWIRPGLFNVIFLRNVLIYFDQEVKKILIPRLIDCLLPEGYLLIGHSESLNGINAQVEAISPSIYQKVK